MKVEKTLNIDEIYRRVKKYGLVLTAEASLADAINNRVESARIGKLAYTPKTLIYKRFQNQELKDKRGLFAEAVTRTNLSWKEASYLLDEATGFWSETGGLDGFPEILDFQREKVSKILDILTSTPNIYREMEGFKVPENENLCVIGLYQFNNLDRSVLPTEFDRVRLFQDESTTLPPFRIFSSANKLVGSVVDNISGLESENVGIIVHPDSIYNPLLRSYLREEGKSFQVAPRLQDSDMIRTFINLLSLGLRHKRVKLKEAGPVIRELGSTPSRVKAEEYMAKIESSEIKESYNLVKQLSGRNFGAAVGTLKDHGVQFDGDIETILKELQLWAKPVNEKNLNNLKYYLDSFPVEVEKGESGILLAEPGAVAYVDRPIVFYLGMTTKWDISVEKKPWKDRERARRKNLNNFKALLQTGERGFYMVQKQRMNQDVTPSTYFNEFRPDLSRFDQGQEGEDYLEHSRRDPRKDFFVANHVDREPDKVTTISQTRLNELDYCPRDYFFSQLVEEPDKDYFRKGTVLHDFAEFYANFTDFVEKKGLETFVELMVERMEPIVVEEELLGLRKQFWLGTKLLRQYLLERDVAGEQPVIQDSYRSSKSDNYFAEKFNKELERKFTEMFFIDESLGARGKVDLINGDELVDYKTGNRDKPGKVVRNSNIDLYEGKPDFQALMYLTYHRKEFKKRKLYFTFFHIFEDSGSLLRGEGELDDFITTVTYYPWSFSEFLGKEEAYEAAYSSNKRKKLLDPLGKERFLEITSGLSFTRGDFYTKEKALSHEKQLRNMCKNHLEVGRGRDITEKQLNKAVRSILKTTFQGIRTENYFKEDLDRFGEYLNEILAKLNVWQRERFPVGEEDLEETSHRDLILEGEGA